MDAIFSTALYRPFAGHKRKFQIRIGEMGELERRCACGIGAIYRRLAVCDWQFDFLRQTILLGLVGGGMLEIEAEALVRFNVDERPLNDHLQLAVDILRALFDGVDAAGNIRVRGENDAPATSDPSTKPAAPSDSPRETSIN